MSQTPRGLRNNNPLNIRRSDNAWVGKITPSKDKEFEQFDTLEHGIRAAFVILRTYIDRRGCNTPQKILMRWAPPSENVTENYIAYVEKNALLYRHQPLRFSMVGAVTRLCWSMACYECGRRLPYADFLACYNRYFRPA